MLRKEFVDAKRIVIKLGTNVLRNADGEVAISRIYSFIEDMSKLDTVNTFAKHGQGHPHFCFAGHVDVVPPGELSAWQTDPFTPTIIDGMLYGRGAADMKGSDAAMLTAAARFIKKHPQHKGAISFIFTSDEEDKFINGTPVVVEALKARHEEIDMCLVGEPSSATTLCAT